MAVDAAHLVVGRSFPVVIEGLHDVANKAGLRFVRKTVSKQINADIAQYDNDGQCE
jgi:hypothetical protein